MRIRAVGTTLRGSPEGVRPAGVWRRHGRIPKADHIVIVGINTKSIGIDHVALNLPTTCEQCHSMDNWMGAKFDHLKFTGFALTGAHAILDCNACHAGGKFMSTPATCVGCHMADFNKTNNPPHAQAGFPNTCQTCHNTTSWDQATFDHNTFTKFPLTGAHANVACTQCHVNGQFVGTPTDCASCHMKDFNGTTNPNTAGNWRSIICRLQP